MSNDVDCQGEASMEHAKLLLDSTRVAFKTCSNCNTSTQLSFLRKDYPFCPFCQEPFLKRKK